MDNFRLWLENLDLDATIRKALSFFQGEVIKDKSAFGGGYDVITPFNQTVSFAVENQGTLPTLTVQFDRNGSTTSVGKELQHGTKQLADSFQAAINYLSQFDIGINFSATEKRAGLYGRSLSKADYVKVYSNNGGLGLWVPQRIKNIGQPTDIATDKSSFPSPQTAATPSRRFPIDISALR